MNAADQYLKDHNIHSILEYLCAQLVYSKPSNPSVFLAAELRKLQSKKGGVGASANNGLTAGSVPNAALSLFNDSDYDVMFSMMDPVGKGTLTAKQVHSALIDLGLDPAKAKVDPTLQQNYNLDAFKKSCALAQQ